MATRVRVERRHKKAHEILLDRRKSDVDVVEHVERGVHLVEVEPEKDAKPQPDGRKDKL